MTIGVALVLLLTTASATAPDPFAWLQPAVTIDAAARMRLEQGGVVTTVLPPIDGEVGIFVAGAVNAGGETLAAWASSIAQLKKSPYVLFVQRFSDSPSPDDLQTLVLDDGDLEDLRRCRPGDCGVKLSADDIVRLQRTAETGGPAWKDAVQQQFRQLVLDRVAAYRSDGFSGLSAYADRRKPSDPAAAFGGLVSRSPYLSSTVFEDAGIESFFYWSKERYGAGKPVIGVTHVDIVLPRVPTALRAAVVSREILATHYRNASLGLTAITEDGEGRRYLVYVNRSLLDLLGGPFGGWKRAMIERKLKSESAGVFDAVRQRLESGPPTE